MSIVSEAIKGAKAHVAAAPHFGAKVQRAAQMVKILAGEIAAIVAMAPYGVRTMGLYRGLPQVVRVDTQQHSTSSAHTPPARTPLGVAVHRDVKYGPLPRCSLDVFVPEALRAAQGARAPVVFFCHGGVWASGEKWHYAPMAVRMAQEGCVVVVITYTLYPEALIDQMVWEVSRALSWTLDHVGQYGGDPARVSAVGHSAGGHLISMALLSRAMAAQGQAEGAHTQAVQQQQAVSTSSSSNTSTSYPANAAMHEKGIVHAEAPVVIEVSGTVPGPSSAAPATFNTQPLKHTPSHDEGSSHAGPVETASYLHGAGTSLPGVLHGMRAAAHVAQQPSADDEWAERHGLKHVHGHGAASGSSKNVIMETAGAHAGSGDVMGHLAAWSAGQEADPRMPALFIGMSAVYDIAKHYEFERTRNVQEISMMKRVMGGRQGFDAFSPTIILGQAADAAAAAGTPESHVSGAPRPSHTGPAGPHPANAPACPPAGNSSSDGAVALSTDSDVHYFRSFAFMGEAIPLRAGMAAYQAASPLQPQQTNHAALETFTDPLQPGSSQHTAEQQPLETLHAVSREAPCAGFPASAARHLPPHVVMGSGADHMVPWHEAAALANSLHRLSVPHKLLLYNHTLHSDFALAWPLLKRPQLTQPAVQRREALQPFAHDFFQLVTGETQAVHVCTPSGAVVLQSRM